MELFGDGRGGRLEEAMHASASPRRRGSGSPVNGASSASSSPASAPDEDGPTSDPTAVVSSGRARGRRWWSMFLTERCVAFTAGWSSKSPSPVCCLLLPEQLLDETEKSCRSRQKRYTMESYHVLAEINTVVFLLKRLLDSIQFYMHNFSNIGARREPVFFHLLIQWRSRNRSSIKVDVSSEVIHLLNEDFFSSVTCTNHIYTDASLIIGAFFEATENLEFVYSASKHYARVCSPSFP